MVLRGGGGSTPANNEIWYTTTDGTKLTPSVGIGWGANIIETTNDLIKFDGDVTIVPARAFYNNESLATIALPDSVTSIKANSFSYCTNLTEIVIGAGVTSISINAFSGCSNLTTAYCKPTTPPEGFVWSRIGFATTIYVPKSALAAYNALYKDSLNTPNIQPFNF